MFESLESRRLLSATLKGGLLDIRGTLTDDDISVRRRGESIIVQVRNSFIRGGSQKFNARDIRGVHIDALAGDDHIDVQSLSIANTVFGGAGDDTLLGSSLSKLGGGIDKNELTLSPPASGNFSLSFAGPYVPGISANTPSQAPSQGKSYLHKRTLVVLGTDQSDQIRLRQQGSLLVLMLNGDKSVFNLASIHDVSVNGYGGDDRIDSGDTRLNAFLVGGAGNDTIFGGSIGDDILGNDGQDKLHGGAGPDSITGGAGSDELWGDDGDDALYSLDGIDDTLHGGQGSDRNDTTADTSDSVESRPIESGACQCGVTVGAGAYNVGAIFDSSFGSGGFTALFRYPYIGGSMFNWASNPVVAAAGNAPS